MADDGNIVLSAAELSAVVSQARESARTQAASAQPAPQSTAPAAQSLDVAALAAAIVKATPQPAQHVPAPVSAIQPRNFKERPIIDWTEDEFNAYADERMPRPDNPLHSDNRNYFADIKQRINTAMSRVRIMNSGGNRTGLRFKR